MIHTNPYHPDQHASAPLGWHRDLADALQRLRDWTAASGTRIGHERPTRQTVLPGEPSDVGHDIEQPLTERAADFMQHVADEVARRHARPQADAEPSTCVEEEPWR